MAGESATFTALPLREVHGSSALGPAVVERPRTAAADKSRWIGALGERCGVHVPPSGTQGVLERRHSFRWRARLSFDLCGRRDDDVSSPFDLAFGIFLDILKASGWWVRVEAGTPAQLKMASASDGVHARVESYVCSSDVRLWVAAEVRTAAWLSHTRSGNRIRSEFSIGMN